jgi:hypothetical protein
MKLGDKIKLTLTIFGESGSKIAAGSTVVVLSTEGDMVKVCRYGNYRDSVTVKKTAVK